MLTRLGRRPAAARPPIETSPEDDEQPRPQARRRHASKLTRHADGATVDEDRDRPPRTPHVARQPAQARVTPDRGSRPAPKQPAVAVARLRDKTCGSRRRRGEIHSETARIEAQQRLAEVAQHDQPMTAAHGQVKRAVVFGHRQCERTSRRWARADHADANIDRQRPDPDMGARQPGSSERDERCGGGEAADAHRATTPTTAWPAPPARHPLGTATGTAHARTRGRRSDTPHPCARSRARSLPRSASS